MSVSTNVCCLPVPISLGNDASKPSIRDRVISTNCRETNAKRTAKGVDTTFNPTFTHVCQLSYRLMQREGPSSNGITNDENESTVELADFCCLLFFFLRSRIRLIRPSIEQSEGNGCRPTTTTQIFIDRQGRIR